MSAFGSNNTSLFRYTPHLSVIDFDINKIDAVFQLSDQFQHIHPFWLSRFHDIPVFTTISTTGIESIVKTEAIAFNEEIEIGGLSITIFGCENGDSFWDNVGSGCIIRERGSNQTVFFQGTAPISNKRLNSISHLDAVFVSWSAYSTLKAASSYVNLYDDMEYVSKADDSTLLLNIYDTLPPTQHIFLLGSDVSSPDGELFRYTSKEYADFLNPYMILCSTSALSFGQCVDISTGEISMSHLVDIQDDLIRHNHALPGDRLPQDHLDRLHDFIGNYGQIILLTDFGKEMFGTSSILNHSLGAARYVLKITNIPQEGDYIFEYNMQINEFVKIEIPSDFDLKAIYPYGAVLDYESLILSMTGELQFWEVANSKNLSQWYLQSPKCSPVTSLFLYFQEMCNKDCTINNYRQRIISSHVFARAIAAHSLQMQLS